MRTINNLEEVTRYLEAERVVFENGIHYAINKNRNKIAIIDKDTIKEYVISKTEDLIDLEKEDRDYLSFLYTIDRKILIQGMDDDDDYCQTYNKILNRYKIILKNQTIMEQNRVIGMLEYTKEFQEEKLEIDTYIMQLLEEGIIPEHLILQSRLFEDMDREEVIMLCFARRVDAHLLAKVKSLKGMNSEHIGSLAQGGFFDELSQEEIQALRENGFIDDNSVIELKKEGFFSKEQAAEFLGGLDEIGKSYRRYVRNKNNKKAELYFSFFDKEDILSLYLKRILGKEDFNKVGFEKEEISNLDETTFLELAKRGFPKGVSFSADELTEAYLEKFFGKSLMKLSKLGYIEPEKLLKLALVEVDEKDRDRAIENEAEFRKITVSQEKLMDMYLEGELTEEIAIEYFKRGMFGLKELEIIFGENYLEQLSVEELFEAYAQYDRVSIQELRDIFENIEIDTDKRVRVTHLIGDNFDKDKLRELFVNDVLTHSDILELQELGRLTEEQSEEISNINRERLYREIFGRGLTNESDGKGQIVDPGRPGRGGSLGGSRRIPMMSAELREEYYKQIGKCDFREVEARDTQGREAPFKNYKLLGFPEYGVVVFENFEKGSNATYIMTLQELKSYVTRENEYSIIFKKSKKALREDIEKGRAVRVCHHTPNWGDNVIGSIQELSKEARESIDLEKRTELADMMREEFIKSRIVQTEGEASSLLNMLVETRARVAKKQLKQERVRSFETEVEEAMVENEEELGEKADGEETSK